MFAVEWLRYIDATGYISFAEFLQVPGRLVNYVFAIRTADNLRQYKIRLMETTDKETRKKLSEQITKLEAIFNYGL